MIVIADTSPLSYLIRIGEAEVLRHLYQQIIIPLEVCNELKSPHAPKSVHDWIVAPPRWLEIRVPNWQPDKELMQAAIHAGERDAILLALELAAGELIIDDLDGRREAERRKLHFVGTLGVLRLASRDGLLDFGDAVTRLRQTNFHVLQELLDRILAEAKP